MTRAAAGPPVCDLHAGLPPLEPARPPLALSGGGDGEAEDTSTAAFALGGITVTATVPSQPVLDQLTRRLLAFLAVLNKVATRAWGA